MSNKQRLELRQAQSLVMTPQLQQSIKLLQLSSIELSAYITQELEKNPLLTSEDGGEEDYSTEKEEKLERNQAEEISETLSGQGRDQGFEENFQTGWGAEEHNVEPSSLIYSHTNNDNQFSGGGDYSFEEMQTAPLTLKEHITNQLNLAVSDHGERIIALHLMDLLDDNGYITDDFSALAELLDCDIEAIGQVLAKLQTLDPPGVFARSAAECLTLQLKDMNHLTAPIQHLLGHLDLLAKGELKILQKLCEVDESELKELIKEIKSLNPKPGANFNTDVVQIAQADVFLKWDSKNNWVVSLNHDVLPKLLINHRYVGEIVKQSPKQEERKYISEQVSSANWLIKILDQRAQTILKVATEIVTQQQAFFDNGIRYLKPLVLSDVAEAVGVHESTVSRVTTHKYIATPMGLYELKYFFSSSVHASNGNDNISSLSVKFLIKELISNETPGMILSDEALAIALKQKGIDIARRTVAKYREDIGIPTSSQRKREKRI